MGVDDKELLIGSNLKMYKTALQTQSYMTELIELLKDILNEELELFIIPSFIALDAASRVVGQNEIKLGAQNMYWEDEGPWTGEISPVMLKELGVEIVELGHSERRQHFGETDLGINKKVLAALKHGLTPLICIGETAEEKELGINIERLRYQLKVALGNVSPEMARSVWIAYEPVWAIGESGIAASPKYANSMHRVLRETLKEIYPHQGEDIPLLYGGSVNIENAGELVSQPEIDGLFIGRAAWDARSFNNIIRSILPLWRGKKETRK